MPRYSYSELDANSPSFLNRLATGLRGAACALRANFPLFTSGVSLTEPAFLYEMRKNAWKALCDDASEDDYGSVPFQGGQCVGAPYQVTGTLRNVVGTLRAWDTNPQTVTGKIIGLSIFSGSWVLESDSGGFGTLPNGNAYSWVEIPVEVRKANTSDTDLIITSINRVDGQPDDCGNPPITLPPETPPAQPVTVNTTINNNYGSSTLVTATFIETTNEGNIVFNIDGVKVIFDNDGVTIPTEPTGDSDTIDEINDNINKPSPTDPEVTEESPEEDITDIVEVIPAQKKLQWLKVTILNTSEVHKAILANNPANSNFFAGWVSFVVDGARLPRVDIRFENSIFAVPEGTSGYALQTTNGARVTVTEFTTNV